MTAGLAQLSYHEHQEHSAPLRVGQVFSAAFWSFLLVLAGSGMQGYANGTFHAPVAAVLFLFGGYLLTETAFCGRKAEGRAFLLTFGICVLTGGLVQCYSLAVFGNPQSTVDAVSTFFPYIAGRPPFPTTTEIFTSFSYSGPGAVVVWQQIYKAAWYLGLDFGPYVGVMFNAVVMGFTASVTVRTAREIFGNDSWRLHRVGTLFALCGMFILFGSVLLRDCFTTFLNAVVIWGLIRWLCKPKTTTLLFSGALTGLSVLAMVYLRPASIAMFALYWAIALACWFIARPMETRRLIAALLLMPVFLVCSAYVVRYLISSQHLVVYNLQRYQDHLAQFSDQDSLAMRLIVNQPLPIRLVLGTGALMITPIPLWAYFRSGAIDSFLIRGYHGLYQVLLLPLVFTGMVTALTALRRNRDQVSLVFLGAYISVNVLAVAATSLELRHVSQFMPAFMILAAVPDTRKKEVQKGTAGIAIIWLVVVVLVHVAWLVAAANRL